MSETSLPITMFVTRHGLTLLSPNCVRKVIALDTTSAPAALHGRIMENGSLTKYGCDGKNIHGSFPVLHLSLNVNGSSLLMIFLMTMKSSLWHGQTCG